MSVYWRLTQILVLLVASMSYTYSQCDTSRNVIHESPTVTDVVRTKEIDKKTVSRDYTTDVIFTSISAKMFRRNVHYTDYTYTTEQYLGHQCQNGVGQGSGNASFRKLFEKGQARDARKQLIQDSIRGVGAKNVDALIWYFENNDAPESWLEFEALVNQAIENQKKKKASNGMIGSLTKVITTYKEQNIEKLGLGETVVECANKVAVCRTVVEQDTDVRYGVKTLTRSIDRDIVIALRGVSLLPQEKESFRITLDEDTLEPIVENLSNYGNYLYSDITVTPTGFQVVKQGRRNKTAVRSSNYEVKLEVDNRGQAIVTIVDRNFLAGAAKKSISLNLVNTRGVNEVEFSNDYDLSTTGPTTRIATGKKLKVSKSGLFGRKEPYVVESEVRVDESDYYRFSSANLRRSNKVRYTK